MNATTTTPPPPCPPWCTRTMPHYDLHEAVIGRFDDDPARSAVVAVAATGTGAPAVKVWAHISLTDVMCAGLDAHDAYTLSRALGALDSWEDLARFRRALAVAARMADEADGAPVADVGEATL